MPLYLRTIEVPVQHEKELMSVLTSRHPKIDVRHEKDSDGIIAIIQFRSALPEIIAPHAMAFERNTAEATANAAISKRVYASNFGTLAITYPANTLTKTGVYTATVTLTDYHGTSNATNVIIHTVDSLKPVITATTPVAVTYANLAAWTGITATATDNVSDDISADIVKTYFQADGTTAVADLAAFKTYLDNSAAGGATGKIKLNVSDEDGNAATEVIVTVTSGSAT